jgi:hypothetical protein
MKNMSRTVEQNRVMLLLQWISGLALCFVATWLIAIADEPSPRIGEDNDKAPRTEYGNAWVDPDNPIRKLYGGERLDLWSLKPIARPEIPILSDSSNLADGSNGWSSHPIDRFLARDWHNRRLVPARDADRNALMQRLTLDLNGVRATFDEVMHFEGDDRPDAYERTVDRLLSNREFGEHWARMWLDVVRYSDSNGFDWDEFRKEAWRFRDWVVRAWNDDLPFDQFLTMQIAGDELVSGAPKDEAERDSLIATGYLRLGPYDNAAKLFNEQDRARIEVLSDLTETTASAFLGLTMSCCRCHDHKTDPLSQADHYRFRAFFAATQFADSTSIDLKSTQDEMVKHNATIDGHVAELETRIESLLDGIRKNIVPEKGESVKEPDAVPSDDRLTNSEQNKKGTTKAKPPTEEELRSKLTDAQQMKLDHWRAEIERLRQGLRKPTVGLLMMDNKDAVDAIKILYQGDHQSPRDEVQLGFPAVLFPMAPNVPETKSDSSTGRRLALARWMVSPENPWTARVIVNRVWQGLFSEGIVATANDFGVTGAPPSNPELLDHLATYLRDSNWSIKSLVRYIVTSRAYRMRAATIVSTASGPSGETIAMRNGLKRMSAEQFRDTVLQVTGLLQTRDGGPPVWPMLSEDVLQANPAVLDDNETKTKGWYPSPDRDQSVRTIYLVQKRTLRIPWLETFDLPENTVSCPKRDVSIVAPQALSLMNSEWMAEAATKMAQSLSDQLSEQLSEQQGTDNDTWIVRLFERVLSRAPNPSELNACRDYLGKQSRAELALVLLNTNEFAFVP